MSVRYHITLEAIKGPRQLFTEDNCIRSSPTAKDDIYIYIYIYTHIHIHMYVYNSISYYVLRSSIV